MAGERIVQFVLAGSSAGAVRAFREVAAASDTSQTKLSGLGTLGTTLKNPWVAAGLAIGTVAVGIGAASADMAMHYASATDQMAAKAGITQDTAKKIGDAFLTTSGQSTFSAQKMMEAFGPVAGQLAATQGRALSVAESMKVMSAATDLAEASHTELGTATSALAGIMQAYSLKAGDAAHASDVLFNTSSALNVPMEDLATLVERLHSKLGPLTPSLADTSGLLVDLAKNGLTGRTAMSAVSTGFATLLGGAKSTNDEVKKLGLNLYDASGQFVGMSSIIGQLQPKLAGMTQQQQLAAERALFGAQAGRELNNVILAGAGAFDTNTAAAGKMGTAHVGATTATSNMQGAIDKAKAAVGNMGVQIGQVLMPWLTQMANGLAIVATWAAQNLPGALRVMGQVFSTTFSIIGGIVNVAVGIVEGFIGSISRVVGVVIAVGTGVGNAAGAIKNAFKAVFEWINNNVIQPLVGAIQHVIDLLNSLKNIAQTAGNIALGAVANVQSAPPGAHRAGGGPVEAGMPYIVGEHRAELFVPNVSGTILPSVPNSRSFGGNDRNVTINQSFTLHGNDTELLRKVQRIVEDNNDHLAAAVTQRAAA